jgi:hypothetical protein
MTRNPGMNLASGTGGRRRDDDACGSELAADMGLVPVVVMVIKQPEEEEQEQWVHNL